MVDVFGKGGSSRAVGNEPVGLTATSCVNGASQTKALTTGSQSNQYVGRVC